MFDYDCMTLYLGSAEDREDDAEDSVQWKRTKETNSNTNGQDEW